MNYYLAPMDNITDYIYRGVVWRHFPHWDKLYAPFIQPNDKPTIVPKEDFDIHPTNNMDIPLVPQILTCDPKGFIRVGRILEDYGYTEINLNLGCPAKLVVSKGKGSAMLADTHNLNHFFETIFNYNWKSKITVKTRLGLTDNSDFEEILDVFFRFPIEELTIHPRFRSDFYGGEPRLHEFEKVFSCKHSTFKDSNGSSIVGNPLKICYNGNIFSLKDGLSITQKYPQLDSIMCGRGAIADPSLGRQLKGGAPMSKDEFISFHNDIYESYYKSFLKERHFLHKMMEMWSYWITTIDCDQELIKKLRLSNSIPEYLGTAKLIFKDDFNIKKQGI